MAPIDFSLSTILGPAEEARLLAEHWPGRPFVSHGPPERLSPVSRLPELQSVESLLEAYRERADLIQTWFPPGDVRFSHWGRLSEALALYHRRARLQFNQVEQCVPGLRPYLLCVEEELGLPRGTATATAIASHEGAKAEPHFDNYPAITMQLRGSKRWAIGGEACPNTLDSFVLGWDGSQLRRFHDGEIPTAMPEDATLVEMRPGSVLFMPRGFLHCVESGEHTLALSFDLVIPMWTEIVVKRLAHHLNRRVHWREFALGLAGGPRERAAARERLVALLTGLPEIVAQLVEEPDAILDGAAPPPQERAGRYRRRPGAAIRLDGARGEGAGALHVSVDHPDLGRSELELTPDLSPACAWLIEQEGEFSTSDALKAAPAVLPANVTQLLSALLEAGALEVIAEP